MHPQLIRNHPLLNRLPKYVFQHLLENASVESRLKGTTLFSENEPCDCCYLILSGRCETFVPTEGGGKEQLRIHGPGDSVGDRDVFHHHPLFRQTARVITDALLLRLERELIQSLLAQKPRMVPLFEQYLREKIQEQVAVGALSQPQLGRVVALAALDGELPLSETAGTLARNLADLVPDPVLELQLTADPHDPPLLSWETHRPHPGGAFCFRDQVTPHVNGDNHHILRLRLENRTGEIQAIAPLLSHAANHFRFVLLFFSLPGLPEKPLVQALAQADTSYLFVRAREAALPGLQKLVEAVRADRARPSDHLRPVLFFAPGERAPHIIRKIREATGLRVHSSVHPETAQRGGNAEAHIRRLAREIARCRVGLALSTGGACGLAHIGVLQALEEAGIEIDLVVGASMGSYIAAMWGYGKSPAEMEALARKVEGRWGLLKLVDFVFPPRRGFVRGNRARSLLESAIGDAEFSDLLHPVRIVATRIQPLRAEVFSEGRVSKIVQASSAMPGICVPVTLDGVEYTDAGISDPLPVDVLEAEGIETIIAVDTILGPDEAAGADKDPPLKRPGFFSRHFNYFAPGNMLNVVLCGFRACQIQVAEQAGSQADVVLRVIGPEDTWYEFHNPAKYIEAGRRAARARLDEIQSKILREREQFPAGKD